jgi:2-polyprenyl-6-methoxyphenol hydroxylase-like FAD-dependent oxidoreductase
VGAGLGGLGAAIAILLAGHDVHVLESASVIAEVNSPPPCSVPSTHIMDFLGGRRNSDPPKQQSSASVVGYARSFVISLYQAEAGEHARLEREYH